MKNWFEVDKAGLAKLLGRREKGFVLLELIQNAWDQDVTQVCVVIQREPGARTVLVRVEDDDPEGFKNLAHAFTLFAESDKKGEVTKRGRFNLGEKLVLAVCEEARIRTTKGEVVFDESGRRLTRRKTEKGSVFEGRIRMTVEEEQVAWDLFWTLIPPKGIKTLLNTEPLLERAPVATFEAVLPTEVADQEGMLRRTNRKCVLEIFDPLPGERASLYEMGIPVVETGDRYHINVHQKVPLNMDRDNVPPAYLRTVRTLTLNHVFGKLSEDDANSTWVRDGVSDGRCQDEAVKKILDLRFGEKRVAYDPSDPEANKRAVAAGYTVVSGNSMSKDEWSNAKRANAILPAGQVTPSPKPYSADGNPLKLLPREKWSRDIQRVVEYAQRLGRHLLDREVSVVIAVEATWPFAATYGPGRLVLNLGKLGHKWFSEDNEIEIDALLIHEFAHEYCSDHLSSQYYEACCTLGAKLKQLADKNEGWLCERV